MPTGRYYSRRCVPTMRRSKRASDNVETLYQLCPLICVFTRSKQRAVTRRILDVPTNRLFCFFCMRDSGAVSSNALCGNAAGEVATTVRCCMREWLCERKGRRSCREISALRARLVVRKKRACALVPELWAVSASVEPAAYCTIIHQRPKDFTDTSRGLYIWLQLSLRLPSVFTIPVLYRQNTAKMSPSQMCPRMRLNGAHLRRSSGRCDIGLGFARSLGERVVSGSYPVIWLANYQNAISIAVLPIPIRARG